MNAHVRWLGIGVLLVLMPLGLQAQTYVVEVRDGQVWLNERRVPPEELPPDFRVDPRSRLQLIVEGQETPVIQVNGYWLRIRDGRLESVTPEMGMPPSLQALLRQSLEQFRVLEERLRQVQAPDVEPYVQALEHQFRQMQRFVERSMETYRQEAEGWGARFYGEHLAEQHLEIRSRQLAVRIREARPEEQRALRKQLRKLLEELFELKQENRRQEIRLMRERLHTLEVQLREREKHRNRIIEQRMRELLGEDVRYRW